METLDADPRVVFELKRQMLFAAGPIALQQFSYAAVITHFAFQILTAEQLKLVAEFIGHLDNCERQTEDCE